jgi:hypothetical protein
VIPTRSSSNSLPYDPWVDLNGDGKIDIYDITWAAELYDTSGDPTRNVNVTNLPLDEYGNLKIGSLATRQYVKFYCQDYGYGKIMTQFKSTSYPGSDRTTFVVPPNTTSNFELMFETIVNYGAQLCEALPFCGRTTLQGNNAWGTLAIKIEIGNYDGIVFAALSSMQIITGIGPTTEPVSYPFVCEPLSFRTILTKRLALKLTFTLTNISEQAGEFQVYHRRDTEDTYVYVPVVL